MRSYSSTFLREQTALLAIAHKFKSPDILGVFKFVGDEGLGHE
jgi:hypothetical protein